MDTKLIPSKKATILILFLIFIGFIFGFAFHHIFYTCSNSEESKELAEQIESKKAELSQLTKVVNEIKQVSDTVEYSYEAEILFSVTTLNTNLVETSKSDITASIPVSKEFYHQIQDSTVLEENTTVHPELSKININKVILVKKSKYEID